MSVSQLVDSKILSCHFPCAMNNISLSSYKVTKGVTFPRVYITIIIPLAFQMHACVSVCMTLSDIFLQCVYKRHATRMTTKFL